MAVEFSRQHLRLSAGRRACWRELGSGPPLVMLHGWSMTSAVFTEVAQLLAGRFRVLCPDLPGHGESEPLARTSLEGMAAAVHEWLSILEVKNPALLGWSLGGQVALELVLRQPRYVEKLLLVASTPCFCCKKDWPHGLPETQIKVLERNLQRAYEKTMGDFFKLQFVDEELPSDRLREILRFAVRPVGLPDPGQALSALRVLGRIDMRSQLSRVAPQTLVMHGDLDKIIPIGAGQYLAEKIPVSRFERMPNTGHSPFFSHPDDAVHIWEDFLKC